MAAMSRGDLRRNPENGWSLFGLTAVTLTASRF